MKLTIIGTGYVGLVTGTCFAEVGHQVICVDNNESKVKLLQAGGIPIYEPGLEEMVKKHVANGRLRFTASTKDGVENSDIIFIAVPTPPQPDGSVDLSYIEGVAREIASAMTSYKIVVDKSTVPVKTGDKVAETIKRYCKAKVEFDVVSNPEFLREGFAVEDLMKPDRVVIGVRSQRPVAAMRDVYTPFNAPIIVTDINSAELIKHAANSFLALKISYINAVSVICEASGANVQEVANGIGLDARIGRRFLDAGLVFRDGKLLITQRPSNGHLGGLWEFPGGKREAGETFEQALHRELMEELGIEVTILGLIESIMHRYPEKTVHLEFYRCAWKCHEPQTIGCPALAWVTREELANYEFPAADATLLDHLARSEDLWR